MPDHADQPAAPVTGSYPRREVVLGAVAAAALAGSHAQAEPPSPEMVLNELCAASNIATTALAVGDGPHGLDGIARRCLLLSDAQAAQLDRYLAEIDPVCGLILTQTITECLRNTVPMRFSFAQRPHWAIRVRATEQELSVFARGPVLPFAT